MIGIMFTGNITKEPIMKAVRDTPVCNFTVAVEPARKSAGKEKETKFINVGAWGKLAEICGQYARKGAKVGITCKDFDLSAWQGKDGKINAQMQVRAEEVEFLSSKVHDEAGRQAREEYEKANPPVDTSQEDFMNGFVDVSGDELPF